MKNTKISKIILAILGIAMLLGGLYTVIYKASYIFFGNAKEVKQIIFEDSFDEYTNKYVEIEVDAVLEHFASQTHTYNFIPVGKDEFYIAWLEDDSLLAVSVKGNNIKEMDRILDETWDYLDYKTDYFTNDTLKLKGELKKMDNELLKYYEEALVSLGAEEAELKIRNLVIDTTESRIINLLASLFLIAIGGFLTYLAFYKEKEIKQEDDYVYSDSNKEDDIQA